MTAETQPTTPPRGVRPHRLARAGALCGLVVTGAVFGTPGAAFARPGGGGHGFGGGGGFRGGHGYGGGFGGGHHFIFLGGGGGGGGLTTFILLVLVLVACYRLAKWFTGSRYDRQTLTTTTDRVAHRTDETAAARAAAVEAQVDNLAQSDPTFDLESLKQRVVDLYVTAQRAWTTGDEATLRRILAPVLYGKWVEELRDYAARGETNVVEMLAGPEVMVVNVANRTGETRDTVTFRITATLEDYVVNVYTGERADRKDRSTRPVEYWTLRKNDSGDWVVSSIEQAEDGQHHLTDAIETDTWNQKSVARQATLETAGHLSGAPSSDVLSLTNISWTTAADAAAGDLSLIDARFDKAVLEVAITEFLEEWALNDGSLDFTQVRTRNRTVMRTAVVDRIQVRRLVARDPITFEVDLDARGIYYEVDRRTEEVLVGDAHTNRPMRLSFTMQLGDQAAGWTVTSAHHTS
ncbi:MAG: hypothetical protein JWR20_990 [Marmoricola sp.]|nr:hypothetical protein [Marmoricola sp.]